MEHEVHIFTKGVSRSTIDKNVYDTGYVSLAVSFRPNGEIYNYDGFCRYKATGSIEHNATIIGELDAVMDTLSICDLIAKDGEASKVIIHYRQPGVKYYADGSWNSSGSKSNYVIRYYKKFLDFWREKHTYNIEFIQWSADFKELEEFLSKHAQNALNLKTHGISDEELYARSILKLWWHEYR